MQVRLSWAERFINYYRYHTKLYARRGKNGYPDTLPDKALFNDLVPFFKPVEKLEAENERLRELLGGVLNAVEETGALCVEEHRIVYEKACKALEEENQDD